MPLLGIAGNGYCAKRFGCGEKLPEGLDFIVIPRGAASRS